MKNFWSIAPPILALLTLGLIVLTGCSGEGGEGVFLNPQNDDDLPVGAIQNNPSTWPMSMTDFKFPFAGRHDDFHNGQIWKITCSYGCGFHTHEWYWQGAATHSIDLMRDDGLPSQGNWVLATARGRVVFAGWKDGYGWCVEMDHDAGHTGRGYKSIVAHLLFDPRQYVWVGDDLLQGTILGKCGASGGEWPAHIHFSIWQNNHTIPLDGISGGAHIEHLGRYCSGNSPISPPHW